MSKRQLTLLVIAVELTVWYLVLSNGGWVYDDNLIMVTARQSGLTWNWLTGLIFQHWGIGYHLGFSLLQSAMPVDYRWGLVAMLVLLGGSIYLLQRIVSLLFGWDGIAVVVAAWFGISILFVRGLQWPAGGFQYLPNTFFDVLCLYAYVRFQIDGQRRWIVVAALALASGLLFYEKPAYMLLYLVLIRVLFLSPRLSPRVLWQALWREREMWAALVAVEVAWAIGFHLSGGGSGVASGSSLGDYLSYFRILWVQALVPATSGLTLPASGLNLGQVAIAVALQLIVVVAVVGSVLRKRAAWRAWAFLAINVLVTGALVAAARVATFGPVIAGDIRYLLDFAWLIPLTACLAFCRSATVSPRRDDTRTKLLPLPRLGPARAARGGTVLAVAGLALAGYLALAVTSDARLQRVWAGPQARDWEQNLEATLGHLQAGGRHVVLADNDVPFVIVQNSFAPYNRLSWVAPLYTPGVRVDGALDGPLATVDVNGDVHRATVGTRLGNGAVDALAAARQLTATGPAKLSRRPGERCVTAGLGLVRITRLVPPAPTGLGPPYYLLLSYRSPRARALQVWVDSGSGYPPGTDRFVAIAGGTATSLLYLDSPSPRRLQIVLSPGASLCLRRIDVVTLQASS